MTALYTLGSMAESKNTAIRFPPEDLALVEKLAEVEQRSVSDIVRRAVRAYAEKLGVSVGKQKSGRGGK